MTVPVPDSPDARLRRVFLEALDLPPDTPCEELEYRREPRWDSVAHLQLVQELEREFRISIGNDDVLLMTSYAAVLEIVTRLQAGAPGGEAPLW